MYRSGHAGNVMGEYHHVTATNTNGYAGQIRPIARQAHFRFECRVTLLKQLLGEENIMCVLRNHVKKQQQMTMRSSGGNNLKTPQFDKEGDPIRWAVWHVHSRVPHKFLFVSKVLFRIVSRNAHVANTTPQLHHTPAKTLITF